MERMEEQKMTIDQDSFYNKIEAAIDADPTAASVRILAVEVNGEKCKTVKGLLTCMQTRMAEVERKARAKKQQEKEEMQAKKKEGGAQRAQTQVKAAKTGGAGTATQDSGSSSRGGTGEDRRNDCLAFAIHGACRRGKACRFAHRKLSPEAIKELANKVKERRGKRDALPASSNASNSTSSTRTPKRERMTVHSLRAALEEKEEEEQASVDPVERVKELKEKFNLSDEAVLAFAGIWCDQN
jgi:hypothetical protein